MSLGLGSIAFVGFNADGADNLAFVALETISAGTVIHFTNDEWNGSGFIAGESTWSWTATGDIAAGTIITLDGLSSAATASSNLGTIAFSGTATGLANLNESVYAYVGALGAPSAFLAAIANDDFVAAGGTLDNTGLILGTHAINLDGIDTDADIAAYNLGRILPTPFSDFKHAQGDKIDLAAIDAIDGGGDNAFSFIGADSFTGVAGQLHYVASAGGVTIEGDTNGDSVADFSISVLGVASLVSGDFIV
jgi:hypothetical protein